MENALCEIQELMEEFRGLKTEMMDLGDTPMPETYDKVAFEFLNQRMGLLLDRLRQIAEDDDEL
jgi:hypothetical protein